MFFSYSGEVDAVRNNEIGVRSKSKSDLEIQVTALGYFSILKRTFGRWNG
jgi:hypothetical protein